MSNLNLWSEPEVLRQNLDKLFGSGFFDAIQRNETAQRELEVCQQELEDSRQRCTAVEGELQQARSEIKELNDKLKPLSVRLEELENLLENKDRQVQELAQKIAAVQADNDSHAAREAELEQEIAQSKQSQAEAEALAMLYLQETKAAEEKLASVEEELRVVLEEQQNKFDIVDIETEDDGHDGGLPAVDLDEWKIKSIADRSTGVSRLRQMLLDNRPSPATSLLETDEVRALLQTVRRICVDKALADLSIEASGTLGLQFPEYLYAWFGNQPCGAVQHSAAEVKNRAAADGECARFLHRVTRFQSKHRELATFFTLVDSCELDEVSYYMHARRVLVGLNCSSQLSIEVPMTTAVRACSVMIMRHAKDAHAQKVRTDMTKSLLSSKSILTASGGVDTAALLAGLLAVYKEEKTQLRRMMQVLHKAGANLRDYPAIHKLRAMLQSVDPEVSDYEVLDIYQRCSIADNTRKPSAGDVGAQLTDSGSSEEPERIVPFGMLWVVLQRHGFLVKRQRICSHYQPDVLMESPGLVQCSKAVLASWLTVKPYVRSLVKKAEGSEFECERLWAQEARQLVNGIEDASQIDKDKIGPQVIFRLKRLLTSTFCAQSLRNDITFPPSNLRLTAEELNLMASVVKQRDLMADACLRSSVVATAGGAKGRAATSLNKKTANAVSTVMARPFTPTLTDAKKFKLKCAPPRPQSAMQ
jgi:hypothetical protein